LKNKKKGGLFHSLAFGVHKQSSALIMISFLTVAVKGRLYLPKK